MNEIYELKTKNELRIMKESATVKSSRKNDNDEYENVYYDLSNVIPINGKDLFYCCAALGMMISNYDSINFNKKYYLAFTGCGTHFAYDNIDDVKREKISLEKEKILSKLTQEEQNVLNQ